MIRNVRGDHLLVITQDDHARLAERLAERLGNARFDGPDPRRETLLGVALHDAGWPLHDDEPTLSPAGLPLHVLESTVPLATKVWRESARRAADADPYAGLLVSLHVFNLSALLAKSNVSPMQKFEERSDLFLMNQFQQDEIERQEQLRRALGLSTDRKLTLGLADPGIDREEDRLRFNFAFLRLCDALSLEGCAGGTVFKQPFKLHPRIGSQSMEMTIGHPARDVVTLDPWPFAGSRIELDVPARRLPATPFATVGEFRSAFAGAPVESHRITYRPE